MCATTSLPIITKSSNQTSPTRQVSGECNHGEPKSPKGVRFDEPLCEKPPEAGNGEDEEDTDIAAFFGREEDNEDNGLTDNQRSELLVIQGTCFKHLEQDPSRVMNHLLEETMNFVAVSAEITLASNRENAQQAYEKFQKGKDSLMLIFGLSCEYQFVIEDLKVLHMFRYGKVYRYFERLEHANRSTDKRDLLLRNPEPFMNMPKAYWTNFMDEFNKEQHLRYSWIHGPRHGNEAVRRLPYSSRLELVGRLMDEDIPHIIACIAVYTCWSEAAAGNPGGLQHTYNQGRWNDARGVQWKDLCKFHKRSPKGYDWEPLRKAMVTAFSEMDKWLGGKTEFDPVW
ncbi:hypothetical protein SCUP234_09568 [Seiridium cupressi]